MLAIREDLVLIDSSLQQAGTCAVCGKSVGEREGITALYRGRILRFRCSGGVARFRRDPEIYLGKTDECCPTGTCPQSPASEWVV
ncbi:MAG TPA: hypothetical protein VF293_03550 [Candidatus Limnocylindrales bacterium]